jgi:hypothetical protein
MGSIEKNDYMPREKTSETENRNPCGNIRVLGFKF